MDDPCELPASNTTGRMALARAYQNAGLRRDAATLLREVVIHTMRFGDDETFLDAAGRLLQLDPRRLDLARELARLHLRRGDHAQALGPLHVCYIADASDVEILGMLAEAFTGLGRKGDAAAIRKRIDDLRQGKHD